MVVKCWELQSSVRHPKRKTSIKNNLFCLDELELEAGDWIDIGTPLHPSQAFPITIKSLVFNKDKKDS